jgi:hypothetical protein
MEWKMTGPPFTWRMNTPADFSKFKVLPVHVKCWILLKPVLGAWTVACNYHYRLQTGSIKKSGTLPCWAFFRDSVFLYCSQNQNKLLYALIIAIIFSFCTFLVIFITSAVVVSSAQSLRQRRSCNYYCYFILINFSNLFDLNQLIETYWNLYGPGCPI